MVARAASDVTQAAAEPPPRVWAERGAQRSRTRRPILLVRCGAFPRRFIRRNQAAIETLVSM